MRSNYLICYDIADPARLCKVLRLAKGLGVHLQYSVFLCSFTWPELNEAKEKFAALIEPEKDDIRIYPLPSGAHTVALGQGVRIPDGVNLFMEGYSSCN